MTPMARHHRHDQAGIGAAGQERAERHISDQTLRHRAIEQAFEFAFERRGIGIVFLVLQMPVAMTLQPITSDFEITGRRQLLAPLENAAIGWHIATGEILEHDIRPIRRRWFLPRRKQRLHCRSKRQHAIAIRIKQRLFAAAIATQIVVSIKTVQSPVSSIFNKLQVADRAQAIIRARDTGLGQL